MFLFLNILFHSLNILIGSQKNDSSRLPFWDVGTVSNFSFNLFIYFEKSTWLFYIRPVVLITYDIELNIDTL